MTQMMGSTCRLLTHVYLKLLKACSMGVDQKVLYKNNHSKEDFALMGKASLGHSGARNF